MNNASDIECTVSELLKLKQFSELNTLLNENENEIVIKDNILNLVETVCWTVEKYQDALLQQCDDIESCSNILMILIDKGNPKEIIIGLLEVINKFNPDVCFQFLLKPIQKTLFRIPNREKFFDYVLNITYAHFDTIPKPENKNYEGEELMLLDLDINVQKISTILVDYLKFLKPFIEEVLSELISDTLISEQMSSQKMVLQNYLLKLLYNPLLFQDLHFLPDRQISSLQSSCQKLMTYLAKLCKNLLNLYLHKDHNDNSENEDNEIDVSSNHVPSLSYANLAYLLFAENLLSECRPYVYSSGYLFEKHMLLISSMLSMKNVLIIYKGIHLCKNLLNRDFTLPTNDMPITNFIQFPKILVNCATYCTIENYRNLLGTLFVSYIKKFSWKSRYSIILLLMDALSNFGVEGTLIDLYRNFLHETRNNENTLKYFVGKNLHAFLRKALYLKNGVKTDILENQKTILSGLNTIRYLTLTDTKDINFTGIYDIISEIKETYLDPLQLGVDISKAHYLLEANNVSKKITKSQLSAESTITVNGEVLQISPDEHVNAMKQAMTSLDLIQSILSNVFEIIEQKAS